VGDQEMTLKTYGKEVLVAWLALVVKNFKDHDVGAWISQAEQCALDTPEGYDIVIEVRASESLTNCPQTLTLSQNCFKRTDCKMIRSNSWIVVNKVTGEAILETWSEKVTQAINTKKYQVMTAYDYLCGINNKQQEEKGT
jgi:hypothetical protein